MEDKEIANKETSQKTSTKENNNQISYRHIRINVQNARRNSQESLKTPLPTPPTNLGGTNIMYGGRGGGGRGGGAYRSKTSLPTYNRKTIWIPT